MPKWLSQATRGTVPAKWHLYPSLSIEPAYRGDDEEPTRGTAVGIAYCGAKGEHEGVYTLQETVFDGSIDRVGDPQRDRQRNDMCADCRKLVKTGRIVDPEWHERFRDRAIVALGLDHEREAPDA